MLELWGGAECTVNRVGDAFRDQTVETGHERRVSDLDLFASLGLQALRFPVLWERVAPDHPDARDWTWSDARLARLRELSVRPIVGLIHHGSGPRFTNLLDPAFASGLADHAGATAERYRWVTDWTPVNEPLTTARFSALYGHWYPHACDERSFWLALLNQIDGVRLAMRAIRRVNPAAQLIQTEDLGRTYATVEVRDQAAFDNVRRWMSWDLLCGRVTPEHSLWNRLCRFGLERQLRAIADDPCPPNVVGVNHYLTSDRFLDHRIARYPSDCGGSNGRERYVDVEAVRVLHPATGGLNAALQEAWQRYGIPLAITEVHNGCTREEQMRWLLEAWRTASALRDGGVDVRAVTSWALLGSNGWNTLLTRPGRYEPGAFDVSGGTPRPTALVPLLKSLSGLSKKPRHPVVQGRGWWRREIRLLHDPVKRPAFAREHSESAVEAGRPERPLLIVGATGTLGGALAAACRHRDLAHVVTRRAELDLADGVSIARALDRHRPWALINAAGWVRVDEAESESDACFDANATGAVRLAEMCASRAIHSTSFSSDLVFGESAARDLVEAALPSPRSVYGRSKAAMELAIDALSGRHLIVRMAAFFSPFDPHNFAAHLVAVVRRGGVFPAADDHIVTPTYLPDLCNAVLDLVIDGEAGLWHLSNGEAVSWAAFGRRIARACDLDEALVSPVAGRTLNWIAPRPANSALASTRGAPLPSLDDAIGRFAHEARRRATESKVEISAKRAGRMS